MSSRILFRCTLAFFFVSCCFLLAALQIPRIGEGAPDWHTVKRPAIPLESLAADAETPDAPQEQAFPSNPGLDCLHPPIAIGVNMRVCVWEPVYGFKYDCLKKQWVRVCLGKHAVCRYQRKTITAYWIPTMNCYGFYDDYGRLRLLPDFR